MCGQLLKLYADHFYYDSANLLRRLFCSVSSTLVYCEIKFKRKLRQLWLRIEVVLGNFKLAVIFWCEIRTLALPGRNHLLTLLFNMRMHTVTALSNMTNSFVSWYRHIIVCCGFCSIYASQTACYLFYCSLHCEKKMWW